MHIQTKPTKSEIIEKCDGIFQGLKVELQEAQRLKEAIDNGHRVVLEVTFEDQKINEIDAIDTIEGVISRFDDKLNREHFGVGENRSDDVIEGRIKDDGFSIIHYTKYIRRKDKIGACMYLFLRSAADVGVDNNLEKFLQKKWSEIIQIGNISFLRDRDTGVRNQRNIVLKNRNINVGDGISVIKDAHAYLHALLAFSRSKR